MNEWNIQTRAHRCEACEAPFVDQQVYHTLLFDEKQAYVRRDICDACWKNDFQNQDREKGFLSYWQGIFEMPPAPVEPIQKKTAETLLRRLIEINNPTFASAGYILAVMLERKRLLKVKEQLHRDGQRWFVYEQPKTGDLFTIADPALQLSELEEVQRTVGALLEFGLTEAGEIAWPEPSAPEAAGETTKEAASDSPEAVPQPDPEQNPVSG